MINISIKVFVFLLIIFLQKIYAKPVKVEEILTYKNQWQLDLGISYSNIEKSSRESQLILIPIGNNQAIPVSNYLGQQIANNTNFSNGYKVKYFKHYKTTLTSYYTVDPIVFFIQASYILNLKEKNKDQTIDLGERFSFSPQIYFAINPYTTINWGFSWYIQGKDKINGKYVSLTQTRTSFLFGASYEITNNLAFNLDYEYQPLSNGYQSSISTRFLSIPLSSDKTNLILRNRLFMR